MEFGRTGDPELEKQTLRQYAVGAWLPNHEIEVTTRQNYTYALNKHLSPRSTCG
jgi:hypothetical protein